MSFNSSLNSHFFPQQSIPLFFLTIILFLIILQSKDQIQTQIPDKALPNWLDSNLISKHSSSFLPFLTNTIFWANYLISWCAYVYSHEPLLNTCLLLNIRQWWHFTVVLLLKPVYHRTCVVCLIEHFLQVTSAFLFVHVVHQFSGPERTDQEILILQLSIGLHHLLIIKSLKCPLKDK